MEDKYKDYRTLTEARKTAVRCSKRNRGTSYYVLFRVERIGNCDKTAGVCVSEISLQKFLDKGYTQVFGTVVE